MNDDLESTDGVMIDLVTDPVEPKRPLNPCTVCGNETVQHDADDIEVRVCTGFDCGLVQTIPGAKLGVS